MNFYIDRFVVSGDGRAPSLAHHLGLWWAMANDGDNCLIATPDTPAALGQATPLSPSVYTRLGIPDNGKRDEADVVAWTARGLYLRQCLSVDLSSAVKGGRVGRKTVHPDKRAKTVGAAIESMMEQVDIRLESRKAGKSGTFTDAFTDTDSTALENHTPTGGTAWTVTGGAAGDFYILSNALSYQNSPFNSVLGLCDDQGDSAQYVQAAIRSGRILNRCDDINGYIGFQRIGNSAVIFKRDNGQTTLASDTVTMNDGDTMKLESDSADAHEAYLDNGGGFGSILGPVTDAFNNTVTGQGVCTGNSVSGVLCDDFEAGLLAATITRVAGPLGGVGKIGRIGVA